MIDAQQMQHRGVQIVDIAPIFDDFITVLVRGAVNCAALDSAAGQPHREPERIVVPAVRALGERSSAKFAGPHDKCFVQQSARLQIFQQAGDRLIHGPGIFRMILYQAAMGVPAVVPS